MASADRELRLGLSGRSLVFPGATPYCLVCGRRAFGTRTQSFKDPEYAERQTEGANLLLRRVHPLLAWANRARLVKFKVDVPLCFRHFWRGRLFDVGVIVAFVAATAGLVWLGVRGKLPSAPSEIGSLMKGLLVAIVLVPGFLLWKGRRGAPVVHCQARREGKDRVVLSFESELPRPR